MPKAKKQESGNWRVRVYAETDSNGKKIYKSFTAPTKKEAEFLAAQFMNRQNERKANPQKITLSEALDGYIERKRNVLSPSTIQGYVKAHTWLDDTKLSSVQLCDLSQDMLQSAINRFAANHSPKSCRNFNGIISAVVRTYAPDVTLRVTLPQKKKTDIYVPTDRDIERLLNAVAGKEIEKAIMLAAFGSLRRSEISPLTLGDLRGNILTVDKAMVQNEEREWCVKPPKTFSSNRQITLPDFVCERLRTSAGRLCNMSPDVITVTFNRAIKKACIPHFRFHDLRHYQASILHAMGVPDKYICERGGWATDTTLKKIYQHTMTDKRQEVENEICSIFEKNHKKYDAKYDTTVNKCGNNAV